jgi:hypothetical protein
MVTRSLCQFGLRTPWITAPFGPSGARYRAETAITLAMTGADIIINFMFDFPLRCPPTQIAKARPYRMDKARVWSKQNTRGKYWNGDTNPVSQERIKNGSCQAGPRIDNGQVSDWSGYGMRHTRHPGGHLFIEVKRT